jgi:hypothetical protein
MFGVDKIVKLQVIQREQKESVRGKDVGGIGVALIWRLFCDFDEERRGFCFEDDIFDNWLFNFVFLVKWVKYISSKMG